MALFDRLRKSPDPLATATIANFATDEGEPVAIVAKLAVATPPNAKPEIPPEPESLRGKIEQILADGPKPYEEILATCGGNEDDLRGAIRGWDDLVSTTIGETTLWEIRSATANIANFATDPITLAERVGIRFEAEIPESLGNPVFQYRGHILAWENDTPETKVYAWGLVNLFPGRPLAVDINSMASLLQLSPREVREALSRLTKDGDLVRTWERGRELFRLNIRYTGGIET